MRNTLVALLFGASVLSSAASAQDQAGQGAADLCKELLAYVEKKTNEPPKDAQAQAPAAAPAPRGDAQGSGTAGGGSVAADVSKDTSMQSSAPTTAPIAPGAASEPTSSPHATDGKDNAQDSSSSGNKEEAKLAGGLTVQQVRDAAQAGDRQSCRDTTQKLRRAGGDLPAALIALAAYEPDPAKRK